MVETARLDVLVRFPDPARISELDRCLFSLVTQDYAPLSVHVLSSQQDDEMHRALVTALAPTMSLNPDVVLHLRSPALPLTTCTALLNEGIAAASGRYLAILSADDVVHPSGYRMLIQQLAATDQALAFGETAQKFVT